MKERTRKCKEMNGKIQRNNGQGNANERARNGKAGQGMQGKDNKISKQRQIKEK